MKPDAERFWSRIEKTEGCWLWTGGPKIGYGTMRVNGEVTRMHRYSFTLNVGQIPDGLSVLHKCDVPKCVRPDHLFLGTDADNAADKIAKGRAGPRMKPKIQGELEQSVFEAGNSGQTYAQIAIRFGVSEGMIAATMRRRGVVRNHTKLNHEIAAIVRTSTAPGVELAAQFGVHESMISRIRKGKAWVK